MIRLSISELPLDRRCVEPTLTVEIEEACEIYLAPGYSTVESAHRGHLLYTPQIRQCHYCSAEYQVAVRLAGKDSILIIRVWREVGILYEGCFGSVWNGEMYLPPIFPLENEGGGRIEGRFWDGRSELSGDVEGILRIWGGGEVEVEGS